MRVKPPPGGEGVDHAVGAVEGLAVLNGAGPPVIALSVAERSEEDGGREGGKG
jgi:hypothetical protein